MRRFGLVVAAAVLMAGPAFAQVSPGQTPAPVPQASPAPTTAAPPATATERRRPARRAAADRGGANNPNAAFMGGGVILEGAPGAPAPTPQAITTPPGPDGVVRLGGAGSIN